MWIASVYLMEATRQFDKEYHYRIPEDMQNALCPGERVLVPFGVSNRYCEAIVVKVFNDSDSIYQLKDIAEAIDYMPVVTENMIQLALMMKKMYICTFADCIKVMLPPGLSMKRKTVLSIKDLENEVKNLKQDELQIVDLIKLNKGKLNIEKLNFKENKNIRNTIKRLKDKGVIELSEELSGKLREKTQKAACLKVAKEEAEEIIESGKINRIGVIRALQLLTENELVFVSDLLAIDKVTRNTLENLKASNIIEIYDIEVIRDPLEGQRVIPKDSLIPNEQQEVAISNISSQILKKEFKEFLIHGVTGSGKTEVYMHVISNCIKLGRQAIVLVPEISLTPQMIEIFRGRFGDDVAVIHSRLSQGERYDQWRLIRDGRIKVCVGARSAIFAPFSNLGVIVVDEEHEASYKSEITPKYNAVEVARLRAKLENSVLICASATPSVESYYKALNGDSELIEITMRANRKEMPKIFAVDMRTELDEGNRSVFSRLLQTEIKKNIEKNEQTILFLNKRGFSSFVMCRSCGYTPKCQSCSITLTYHMNDGRFICHHCGYSLKYNEICPKCKSKYFKQFGAGTQKIEAEILKQFEGASVIRMDMDTTSRKNSFEKMLSEFRQNNVNIMIGTQMIAKGHDFPNVTLVGVLAADLTLNIDDFRSVERTFQLISQVAGRAGRAEKDGRVIVQGYNIENYAIQTAVNHDYKSFYEKEIAIRKKLNYPPFTNIASVIISSKFDSEAFKFAKAIFENIKNGFCEYSRYYELLGPGRPHLAKLNNRYRWRIIVKCDNIDVLRDVLTKVSDEFYKIKKLPQSLNLSIDINPYSFS